MSKGYVSKGERIPINGEVFGGHRTTYASRSDDTKDWVFIPSCPTGIFRDAKQEDNSNSRKRKYKSNHGWCKEASNLETLLSKEIRQCDVCARTIVMHSSLQQKKSIADSLPRFIERHIPKTATPLQCSFCSTENSGDGGNWCGSLYCSRECQIRGEKAIKNGGSVLAAATTTTTTTDAPLAFPSIPPPKLFFCQNRFNTSNCDGNNSIEQIDVIKETKESLLAIEKRLKSVICGYDEPTVKVFGVEECALLLITMIACTCPDRIREMISSNTSEKQCKRIDSNNEESLVEEFWVMSKSHNSMCELLQKYNNNDTTLSESTHVRCIFPSHEEFLQCYLDIKRCCLLRVNAPMHPLMSYATKTIISPHVLSEKERSLALDLLKSPCFPQQTYETETKDGTKESSTNDDTVNVEDDTQSAILRWRNAAHFAHWISTPSAMDGVESTQIRSYLQLSYFVYSPWMFRQITHSCVPTLALAIPDYSQGASDKQESPLDSLAWLALHDIPSLEQLSVSKLEHSFEEDVNQRSAELKRLISRDFACYCIRCQSETASDELIQCLKENGENQEYSDHKTFRFTRHQLKCIADLAMQSSRFEDASKLYECILKAHPHDGNVLHARAAAMLGQASSVSLAKQGHCNGHFLKAQRLWEEAGLICSTHSDIAIHVEKQRVYKTLQVNEQDGDHLMNVDNVKCSSYLDGKCFQTIGQILSLEECQHAINTAEAQGESGWTTSRHYAVPTTDIPLHELAELHTWFYQLWKGKIRPLVRKQFQLTNSHNLSYRDIFLHDAFLVRYDAERQRYLPPHFDESTHSFIIALNSDFKGGG